jgi:hypothetical protein
MFCLCFAFGVRLGSVWCVWTVWINGVQIKILCGLIDWV